MSFLIDEISDVHVALTRARAAGFEKTAEAMQKLLDDMLAAEVDSPGATPRQVPEMEDYP